MAGQFGKGYVKDIHDVRDWSLRKLFGAMRAPAVPTATLEQFVDVVRDQGQTSCCVGFAFARAVQLRCAAMGVPIQWPSPSAIYTEARAYELSSPTADLTDTGCAPRDAIKGMAEWGIPTDASWPFDPATIDDKPDLGELEAASAAVLHDYFRIDTLGAERVLDVRSALSQGYPVAIGVEVDNAFEAYAGTGAVTAPDPANLLGGHMLCLVGYQTNANGTTRVRGVNSWSVNWGDRGFFWADEAWLTDTNATDLWVITSSPR
jgi:hypothetical protein